MTYSSGEIILADDVNDFITTVNNVYGVGSGDRGYGQTAISQSTVVAPAPILSSQWNNLLDMITVCGSHQGTGLEQLPPSTEFDIGDLIIAETGSALFRADVNGADEALGGIGSGGDYEFPNYPAAIDENRLQVSDTSLSVATGVYSVTRTGSWTGSIAAEVSVTWASEDAARYYFNSGGQIRMTGSQPTGSSDDNLLHTELVGVGTVMFAAHATTNTGTTTGSQDVGFYELTNSYQTAGSYTGTIGTVTIEAKRLNYVGTHGGNGNGVQFRITVADTGPYVSHTIATGLSFSFDEARATTFLSGIPAPSAYATVDPF